MQKHRKDSRRKTPESSLSAEQRLISWLIAGARKHRVLVVVYTLAGIAAWYELKQDGMPTNLEETKPEWYLNENYNLAEVTAEIYPNRSNTLWSRAFQVAHCTDYNFRQMGICRNVPPPSLQQIREMFEEALATGDKSNEQLLYNYATLLLKLEEDPDQVEAAIRDWQINFPASKLPHPRDVVEQEIRQLREMRRQWQEYQRHLQQQGQGRERAGEAKTP